MRIAITGHTRGIGKALFDTLSVDHTVKGYSKSNGYDITQNADKIVLQAAMCDVFINNAHSGWAQVDVLGRIYRTWQSFPNRTIVNISSVVKYPNLSSSDYGAQKSALSHQALSLMFNDTERRCRIININPGYVDTDMTRGRIQESMLSAQEVADAVAWAIAQPAHIEIGELTILPAPA